MDGRDGKTFGTAGASIPMGTGRSVRAPAKWCPKNEEERGMLPYMRASLRAQSADSRAYVAVPREEEENMRDLERKREYDRQRQRRIRAAARGVTDEEVVEARAEFERKLDSFERVLATFLDDVALAA
jgi:hypothetical protein